MNSDQLQELLDRIAITSWQRWILVALAIVSATAASTVSAVVEGHQTGGVVVLIVALALAASLRADSHIASVTMAIVVWQWIAGADDLTTPWSIALAGCLLAFHVSISIMAVTPITAVVGADVLLAWARRVTAVMAATPAMWVLVVVLEQDERPGRVLLTAAGLITLGGLVLAARWRLVAGSRHTAR